MPEKPQIGDRRRYHRVGFHADAILKLAIGTVSVEVLDISLAGALMKVDSTAILTEGSPGSLILRLSDEVQIKMKGEIVVHGDGNYAIRRKLTSPGDDHHLKRLLELNLGGSKLLERDIQTLISEHQRAG